MGMVSPVAGFGGIMQAISVVNIILGCDNSIFKEMIIFDSFARSLKKIKVKKIINVKSAIINHYFLFSPNLVAFFLLNINQYF